MPSPSIPAPFALILFSFVLPALAQSCFNDSGSESYELGRTFFLSSEAPLSNELSKFPSVVSATDLILTHFDRVEDSIIASLSTGKAPAPTDTIRPCNNNRDEFGKSVRKRFKNRGWPDPSVSCLSDVFGVDLTVRNLPQSLVPQYTVDDLYEALYNRGKVIKDNIVSITNAVIDNFTNPDLKFNYPYETPYQKCVLHPFVGWRVGDNWYTTVQLTNPSKSAQLRLLGRNVINEFPRVVNGRLGDNRRVCKPVRPKEGEVQEFRDDTTTMISSVRGASGPSFLAAILLDQNPAILQSLDDSELFVQQAIDALTASSIAILVLPLGLNLVPISLLADVSTRTMLIYTLLSDILTVVPLGIKGAELMSIGRQRHRSIYVRITSADNGSRGAGAAAEMDAAECRAHDHVLPAGIVFVVLSAVFLVGGIAAELLARSYVKKRKERRLQEVKEAGLTLPSTESSGTSGLDSKGTSPPHTLTSFDIYQTGATGGRFDSGLFEGFYKETKGEKKA